MAFENSPEQYRPRDVQQPSTAALLPSNREMQSFYQPGNSAAPQPAFLDFGSQMDLYGKDNVTAQSHWDITGEIAPYGKRPSDQAVEGYKRSCLEDAQQAKIDKQTMAKDNWQFLDQFLIGHGKDVQAHLDQKNDPVLKEFMASPGAQKIRDQFTEMGNPSVTEKLGYGTWQAYEDTVKKPFLDAIDQAKAGKDFIKTLLDHEHWGNVGTQVGGFGNPPKDETPWATTMGRRVDGNNRPDPNGQFVQFKVVNLGGMHSFGIHLAPNNLFGEHGPMRTIVQVFEWSEPLQKKQ